MAQSIFEDGSRLDDDDIRETQREIIEVLKKHTDSVLAATYILKDLDVRKFAKL